MRLDSGRLRLSATDLANHLACARVTALDRAAAEGRLEPPSWSRPDADVLRERGFEHERAYLEHLAAAGRAITRLDDTADTATAIDRTRDAMRAGADVIVQATLAHGHWFGRADVLMRVERPSALGAWSYEALDTKLARETKAGAILQLCVYSELIAEVQGAAPEWMHVVPRRPGFPRDSHRVAEYVAYYRFVRRRLETAIAGDGEAPYPLPVPHCDVCRWWRDCDRKRRADDHLSLVAGISRLQTRELEARDVARLARLAVEPLPLQWKPVRGVREGYVRVREQARIQLEGRAAGRTLHELLPVEPGHGLCNLPAPSPQDLFLDLEADPYVDEGGLEYLFGWVVADPPPDGMLALDTSPPVYHREWATGRLAERRAFEHVIDTIMARWARDPNMHVYHYGVYEPGATKRLMGRYGTRETEVDRLLRSGRFVDLYAIVKQGLRASVESYSIKQLEPLYRFVRQQPLEEADAALRALQRSLELGEMPATDDANASAVEAYNRDDCLSTLALRDWLEGERAGAIDAGADIPRPNEDRDEPNPEIKERERRAAELAARLMSGVPEDPAERNGEQRAVTLLAHLLDWHRREDKAQWWEYFRLRERTDEELLDETSALAGLEFVERLPRKGRERTPTDRYRFPAQETKIRDGDVLHLPLPAGCEFGEVIGVELGACTIDIKKRGDCDGVHPTSVFAHQVFNTREVFESLMRLGEWVAEQGVDAAGPLRAARDLLLGLGPRIAGHAGGALRLPGETAEAAACRLALVLDHGTLAIQGPPGTGKTYAGARMVRDLARAGKRVGICAASHKVIRNLMDEVVAAAAEADLRIACVQKVPEPDAAAFGIVEMKKNEEVRDALRDGRAQVAGGTSWMWARPDFEAAVDVLFVDEAGQMSLANVLAIAPAAENLVLLGDPQQLEQPIQGTHPEGAAVSALEHVLGGAPTIAPERGLFLEETWRLPPAFSALTSELFYEGRLHSHAGLETQALAGCDAFDGAGFWFVPVEHDANQSASLEEVEVVAGLLRRFVEDGGRWRDRHGVEHPIELEDVLVIAPYNAQVADLAAQLPHGARVGTVDRFQGQEAPVVIYSLTSSTPEDAPRGMEFLYDPNRFNVATSRAQCACIVVGSPKLFEPDCQTPRQIRLANAFCRFLEVANEVRVDALSQQGGATRTLGADGRA